MAHDNNEIETWPRECETLPAGRHVAVLGGALMSVIPDSSDEPGAAVRAGLYWFDPIEKVYRLIGPQRGGINGRDGGSESQPKPDDVYKHGHCERSQPFWIFDDWDVSS